MLSRYKIARGHQRVVFENVNRDKLPKTRIDCGVDDFLIEDNRAFHEHLNKINIPHEIFLASFHSIMKEPSDEGIINRITAPNIAIDVSEIPGRIVDKIGLNIHRNAVKTNTICTILSSFEIFP